MKPNPIAFNPDTMTVSQLKECAETLRMAFDLLGRDFSAEEKVDRVAGYIEDARDSMLRRWTRDAKNRGCT